MTDTAFYNDMAETVVQLLTEFGRADIVIIRGAAEDEPYDPIEGEYDQTPGDDQLLIATGLTTKITTDFAFRVGTENISVNDRRLILDAQIKPLNTDQIVVEDNVWNIQRIIEINPAGIPLAYEIQVRP